MQCHTRVQWISRVDCTPGLARDLLLKIDQQATNSSCVDRNHAPRRLNNWLSQLMSLRKTALRLSLNIRNQCKLQQCVCRWWKCSDPIIGSSTRNIRGTCHVHCAFSKPCHQELRYTLLWIHTLKIALNSWSSGGMNHHRPTSSVAAEPNCRETSSTFCWTTTTNINLSNFFLLSGKVSVTHVIFKDVRCSLSAIHCIRLSSEDGVTLAANSVEELYSNQEEADTRIILHCLYEAQRIEAI